MNRSEIVADDPVSALDVSVQAQVINLLINLQDEFNLVLLFISHDLAVVEHVSHRIAVMYVGKLVEITDRQTLFKNPQHPYTEALFPAVPTLDPVALRENISLVGDVPSSINRDSGCQFHTRCPNVMDQCRHEDPPLKQVASATSGCLSSTRSSRLKVQTCERNKKNPPRTGVLEGFSSKLMTRKEYLVDELAYLGCMFQKKVTGPLRIPWILSSR